MCEGTHWRDLRDALVVVLCIRACCLYNIMAFVSRTVSEDESEPCDICHGREGGELRREC